jgi:hypothetical protein
MQIQSPKAENTIGTNTLVWESEMDANSNSDGMAIEKPNRYKHVSLEIGNLQHS